MTQHTRNILLLILWSALGLSPVQTASGADAITHQITLSGDRSWCSDGMINGLFSEVNTFRTAHGVPPLSMSALGMKDAEIRATQFATYMQTTTPGTPVSTLIKGIDTTPRFGLSTRKRKSGIHHDRSCLHRQRRVAGLASSRGAARSRRERNGRLVRLRRRNRLLDVRARARAPRRRAQPRPRRRRRRPHSPTPESDAISDAAPTGATRSIAKSRRSCRSSTLIARRTAWDRYRYPWAWRRPLSG